MLTVKLERCLAPPCAVCSCRRTQSRILVVSLPCGCSVVPQLQRPHPWGPVGPSAPQVMPSGAMGRLPLLQRAWTKLFLFPAEHVFGASHHVSSVSKNRCSAPRRIPAVYTGLGNRWSASGCPPARRTQPACRGPGRSLQPSPLTPAGAVARRRPRVSVSQSCCDSGLGSWRRRGTRGRMRQAVGADSIPYSRGAREGETGSAAMAVRFFTKCGKKIVAAHECRCSWTLLRFFFG